MQVGQCVNCSHEYMNHPEGECYLCACENFQMYTGNDMCSFCGKPRNEENEKYATCVGIGLHDWSEYWK